MTQEHRTASVIRRALVVLLSMLLAVGVLAPQAGADPDDATPDELQQRIDDLVALRYRAEADMQTAVEDHNYAQSHAEATRQRSDDLNQQLESSQAILESSRKELRRYAVSSYRTGQTSMPALEPLMSDGDFESVLRKLEADSVVSGKVTRIVERHHADLLYVTVVEERAREAQEEADQALIDAEAALIEAERVLDEANKKIEDAYAERDRLIIRLAEQTARDLEEVTQEQEEREANPPVDLVTNPRPQPTPAPEPTSVPTQTPQPTATPTPTKTPKPTTTPTTTPTPKPTQSPSPTPTPSATPSPTPTPTPSPTATPKPPPNQGDLGKGTSVGSAAQGLEAVAWAKTQLGKPYLLGGAGPNSYDCSGLTMRAWEAAGVNVTRTSRSQYQKVKKIEMSQLRPGDLIFWANNTNDPSTIRHVAMYIGNNQVIEAPRPGGVVRIVELDGWRVKDMMQYAGRP